MKCWKNSYESGRGVKMVITKKSCSMDCWGYPSRKKTKRIISFNYIMEVKFNSIILYVLTHITLSATTLIILYSGLFSSYLSFHFLNKKCLYSFYGWILCWIFQFKISYMKKFRSAGIIQKILQMWGKNCTILNMTRKTGFVVLLFCKSEMLES